METEINDEMKRGRQAVSDKIGRRKRTYLDLTRLHVEIETDCYEYVKAAAAFKGRPMGEYVNGIIKHRMERAMKRSSSSVQEKENPC